MLISEFADRAGLSVDTVRFYIRKGLIVPERSSKGGRNPYQLFNATHIQAAKIIRIAQSLGLSLNDLSEIDKKRRAGRYTSDIKIDLLSTQLSELETKAAELDAMTRYLKAKIDWLKKGEKGSPPDFDKYAENLKERQSRPPQTFGCLLSRDADG